MTSSHEQNRTLFFLSVRHALFRVLFLYQFGKHWAQNIGFVDTNRIDFLWFWILAGNGRIWRKSEKKGFLDGQKQANISIFVPRPQISLTISQGSIIFFVLKDMSVMCLSLLTNTVGLKGKELQFMGNGPFLSSGTIFSFTYSGKGFDNLNLLWLYVKCATHSLYCFVNPPHNHIIYLLFNNYRSIHSIPYYNLRHNTTKYVSSTPFMF